MFNKKMLLSIFVLGLAVSLAGAGTWASLQDTGTDTANTFTAGTLDMKLANNGDNPSDNVEATWVSPPKFKPGDTFTAELRFSNVGSVGANHLYLTPHLGTSVNGPNGGDLADRIYITNIQGHFLQPPIIPAFYGINLVKSGDFYGPLYDNNHWTGLRYALGDHDGTLTLKEFCNAKFVAYYYDLFPILRPNSQPNFGFIISGKFGSADDDNKYQGSSCTFTLDAMASQDSPTDGCVLVTDEQKTDSQDDGSE